MDKLRQHKSFIILGITLIIGIILNTTLPGANKAFVTLFVAAGFFLSFYFHNKEMKRIRERQLGAGVNTKARSIETDGDNLSKESIITSTEIDEIENNSDDQTLLNKDDGK